MREQDSLELERPTSLACCCLGLLRCS